MWSAFNDTKGNVVVSNVREATSMWARFWGLMGRASLADDGGLLLRPCSSVHTFFMRFPIDAVFLDSDLRVLAVRPDLGPWRTAGHRGARAVLELPAGESNRRGIRAGDRLVVGPS